MLIYQQEANNCFGKQIINETTWFWKIQIALACKIEACPFLT